MIFGLWYGLLHCGPGGGFRPGDQERMLPCHDLRRNRGNLIGRLAQPEYDLGKTLPDFTMVIDFGKAKVFKGLLPQSGQNAGLSGFQGDAVLAKILQ